MTEASKLNNALFKYFSGVADYQDKALIREWLSLSLENKREFDALKQHFENDQLTFDSHYASSRYGQLKKRIENQDQSDVPVRDLSNKNSFQNWYYKIAATLLILVSLTFLILNHLQKSALRSENTVEVEFIHSHTKKGERLYKKLPDGSEVWLNSESGISYPKYFSDTLRKVEVYGEVFFEVSHDETRQFRALIGSLQVEVLGTSFNVRAYKNENEKKISLVTGKVKVCIDPSNTSNDEGNPALYLSPGHELVFNEESKVQERKTFDIHFVTSWKEGALIFNGENFFEMAKKLERWYGVEVNYSGVPPDDFIVRGEFVNENLSNVLEVMKFGRNFEFQLNKNSLMITFKKLESL
jgi:transmembrane sensor